ncbi:MAG: acyl-CoA transferase [Betaproteobacteria bacterium SG8_40]|nr:MAG: acyl-CoA transferase [Betaproteobacteria bacterium SG8_40]
MTAPLADIRVLDFSTLLPGPMATLMLAEAGAEVIKVERPGSGEDMRHYPPYWGRESINFSMLNRGKKSVAIDLKNRAERERLRPLIESADVLVEQFRPGVMQRLELDYESVARVNPKVIYCSISGFGQTGPKRDRAGHDLNYIGDAGLLSLSMGTTATPVIPPALIADIAGGSYPAVMNILLALRERDRTGKGAHLDIAMTEGVLPFMYWAIGNGAAAGSWPVSGGELVTGGSPRYRLYPTADGNFVAAGPLEDKFWAAFAETIGLETQYRDDSVDPQATAGRVAQIISQRDAAHWEPLLLKADCCCTIVKSAQEAMQDEHFRQRGVFNAKLVNEQGDSMPATPVPIAPSLRPHGNDQLAAPALGANNRDLLE